MGCPFCFLKLNFTRMGELIGLIVGVGIVIAFVFKSFSQRTQSSEEAGAKSVDNWSKTDDHTS
jgi:hypothetical protein